MENRVILITGANGGLGRAFIKILLENNPKKIYCTGKKLENLKELQTLSNKIEILELDITDINSIKNIVPKTNDIDILINNAGVNSNSRFLNDDFRDIDINFKGSVNVCKAFFEVFKQNQTKVINISSILALINLPIMSNYSASKSALHSFTQALRAELSPFAGEVYEVFAGPIDTKLSTNSPMPKANPEDIAREVIKQVSKKEFEIFPDDFSIMIKEKLKTNPKELEKEFAKSILI